MKRSTSNALARSRRQSKKSRSATVTTPASTSPETVRSTRARPTVERPHSSSPRAARSAYVNAFCAFLHSPAQ